MHMALIAQLDNLNELLREEPEIVVFLELLTDDFDS